MSQISKEIFDKIRTRFSNVQLGDSEGNTTLDSDQAVFFEFDYKDRGSIVINLQDDLIKIYFNNDMISEMDSEQSDNWYAWMRNMRKYAHANMLNFEVKNIDKQRLDRKDFEYLVKNSGQQEELTMESKMYGSKKKSYQDLNGARMVVKHARTVDEEKRGARSRNISAVYIENKDGERFKFPNTYLPAARAMTRHISNEGYPNDERGKHILEIMAEMMDLRKFSRRTKRQEYTEEAREIIGDATDRYYGLKDTLEGMKKQTGYEQYFENWAPDQIEVDENDLEDLKIKLTREIFDDELSDTLTNVGKAVAMGKIKREDEENRIGSEAANLKTFAAGSDPIMMHPNPEAEAELRNYQMFIKNSNMPKEKRNLAMVQRIMMDLSNRMVDDALASAIGRLDMDNSGDAATAFAMAKKYLKGETQIQAPKAKKDLYGRDKPVESWDDFERAVESTVEESVVQEGTWALPETEADAMKIAAMMDKPVAVGEEGQNAIDAMGGMIGDDELYDDLGAAGDKDPEADARPIIIGWMMEHTDWENPKYSKAIKMALDKIRADGNDSDMVIPRMFGNPRNTSATQGERMGSNAAQIKQNEDAVTENAERIVKIKNVKWDVDNILDDGDLPKNIIMKIDVPHDADEDDIENIIANDLTTRYGFVHDGFDSWNIMESAEVTENAERIIKVSNIDYAGPALDELPTETTLKLNIPYDANEDDIDDMVADELEDRHGVKVNGFETQFAESIEEGMKTLKCKDCGDMLGQPTTDCECDSMDPKGDNWMMVDVDNDGDMDIAMANEGFAVGAKVAPTEEGPDQAPGKVVAVDGDKVTVKFMDGSTEVFAQDELFALPDNLKVGEGKMSDIHVEIQDMVADGASNDEIKKAIPMASDSVIADIRSNMDESVVEADEASDMIAKMKAMAGVGSNAKSNHGIREGEAGYQITPRSIVAREMRKLQDIANN